MRRGWRSQIDGNAAISTPPVLRERKGRRSSERAEGKPPDRRRWFDADDGEKGSCHRKDQWGDGLTVLGIFENREKKAAAVSASQFHLCDRSGIQIAKPHAIVAGRNARKQSDRGDQDGKRPAQARGMGLGPFAEIIPPKVKAETSGAYEKPEQVQERFGLRHGYHSHDNSRVGIMSPLL